MSFAAEIRKSTRPVLPLAAMVDVLFLLLIFFMTASVFREQELHFDISLPTADTARTGHTVTQITITLTAKNQIYLGQQELTLGTLDQTLGKLLRDYPNKTVVIRGDQASDFGLAVQVMDIARNSGARDVLVATVKSIEEVK